MVDNTVRLSEDPNYKHTVARMIEFLNEIHTHVEKDEKSPALSKIEFFIESLEGQEQL